MPVGGRAEELLLPRRQESVESEIHRCPDLGGQFLDHVDAFERCPKRRHHRLTRRRVRARRLAGLARAGSSAQGAKQHAIRVYDVQERVHTAVTGERGKQPLGTGAGAQRAGHEHDLVGASAPERWDPGRVQEDPMGDPACAEQALLGEREAERAD